jgi:hypothetical protein
LKTSIARRVSRGRFSVPPIIRHLVIGASEAGVARATELAEQGRHGTNGDYNFSHRLAVGVTP